MALDEPIGPVIRREIRRKKLGALAQCACGERDPLVLQRTSAGVECARCEATRITGKPAELHHPAGRANAPFAVLIDANLHALFSDAQYDWPVDTLVNRERLPHLKLAAMLRAFVDFCRIALPMLLHELEELIAWLERWQPEGTTR